MPLKKQDFVELSKRWNLPPSYLHMRKYGNGCGSLTKCTLRDESGLPCGLRMFGLHLLLGLLYTDRRKVLLFEYRMHRVKGKNLSGLWLLPGTKKPR